MQTFTFAWRRCLYLLGFCLLSFGVRAQTDTDGLLMPRNQLCIAGLAGQSSWDTYWEGTYKRDNANLGRVSTRTAMLMLNYGLKENLNLLLNLPYVATQASAGTLAEMRGLQDVSFFVKWRPVQVTRGTKQLSLFAVGGYSFPTNPYNVDLLPLSIGLGSKTFTGRLLADLQAGRFTAALSGAYLHRGNVTIDREAYYTNRQVNSSEVWMPDAGHFQARSGYRSRQLTAEVVADNFTTFGGFDIRKNDMPLVSNRMNSTRAGVEVKYFPDLVRGLGLHAGTWHTLHGRNVGQATSYLAGLSYIFNFSPQASN